jgi:RNA polymerase sigma-70 factor (ECF subfamily)
VQGAGTVSDADLTRQREVIDAFLAALPGGDFEALVAVLDPDVVIRADSAAAPPGAPRGVRGARTWAKGAIAFSRSARFARPALVNGAVGVVMAPRGRLFRALSFTVTRGKIVQIDVVADPARLRQLDLAVLND